jgi:hypothetical protein
MSRETAIETRYGLVDAQVLDRLRHSLDTTQILRAVEAIDRKFRRIGEREPLRTELLELHGMAHDLINDAGSVGLGYSQPIWALASSLAGELEERMPGLTAIAVIEELARLEPSDEVASEAEG